MLLVCNGAQKSGSTWLYNILTSLVDCKEPDPEYLTGNSKNPYIAPGKLKSFLQNVDFVGENYISKNHLSNAEQRDLLLKYSDVYVFDIERDPKDVVVSSYYDARNRFEYKHSFSKFCWSAGRELVSKLMAYHALWRSSDSSCHVASTPQLTAKRKSTTTISACVLSSTGSLGTTPQNLSIRRCEAGISIRGLLDNAEDKFQIKAATGPSSPGRTSWVRSNNGRIIEEKFI